MDDATHKPPAAEYHGPGIRWDDLTIEREAGHMPAELREGYAWLKSFTRDRCARDVDLLLGKLRELGVSHDKSTLSKILRGRWGVNEHGADRPTPVLAAEKLLRLIEALRTGVRAEALQGRVPFVMTGTARSIFDYCDLKRSGDRVNRFGIVIGPTGAQKTATFREYHRQRNHGSTWWFESPSGGAIGAFIGRLGACAGLSEQTNAQKVRSHLRAGVRPDKLIIVDNAQSLYRHGQTTQPVFDYLRELQDETGLAVVLSITPTFERELTAGLISGYFEQFEGRSGGRRTWLRLPEHAPAEDCVQIAEAFGLREARKHAKGLVEIARQPGRIRILFETLQDAKRLALADKQPLAWSHVEEALEA